ncbi:alpha/beta fold hydrolase [Bacillaceae bacterium S4-13-58]
MIIIKAILVHGYKKDGSDMAPLKNHLEPLGYTCLTPDFSLTYKEFDKAAVELERIIDEHFPNEKPHLIGHSTGGLVIRKVISNKKYKNRVGRCVLIATPNNGSRLAELAGIFPFAVKIYRTLKSLHKEYIKQLNLTSHPTIELGAIAGNKNNLLLGKLIPVTNDGRVELDSVYFPDLNDYVVLPYGHLEIHHKKVTAQLVDQFLKRGTFKK